MIALTVPAIAFAVYIAQFKQDFEKKDLELLVPVCTVFAILGIILTLLGGAI